MTALAFVEDELPFGVSDDKWWRSSCQQAITAMASTGREFQAFDLVEQFGLGEPSSTALWGSVFRLMHLAGVIRPVGYAQSKRPTVAGSACRTWRGV
jgi:hypothetical protein